MHRYQFRGVLGVACMMAGLGVDALPPPRPRAPEPTVEEIEALAQRCIAAGIDILALGERSRGDGREFKRLAERELAILDVARSSTMSAQDVRDEVERAELTAAADRARGELHRLAYPKRRPGRLVRDAREAAGMSLRELASAAGLAPVDLGDIERCVVLADAPTWARLREALPELPEEQPESTPLPRITDVTLHHSALDTGHPMIRRTIEEAQRREAETERQRYIDRFLHPAGRCTCGGGGAGTCAWCKMDQARQAEEEAAEKARAATLEARRSRRPAQAEQRRAKARKTKRRGF